MTVSDFRHPQEVQRLNALQSMKVMNLILNIFNKAYANITSFATVSERNYPVTACTQPRLHRLYRTAKDRLGVTEEVPVYLKFDYAISAETIGTDGDCAIIVSNCCLETLTDDELLAILARELGHIAYKHVKYINIIRFFDDLTQKLSGIAETAILTTKNILIEWLRCAEYTADRAAAVAVGSVEPPCMAIAKAMGAVDDYPQISFSVKQLVSEPIPLFPGDGLGKVGQIAFQNIMTQVNVPFGMLRVRELWDWSRSDECRASFAHIYYSNSCAFGLESQSDPVLLYSKAEMMLKKSPTDGLPLLHRAAQCGSPAAMCSLGKVYMEGNLVPRDESLAICYLQRAVAAKHPAAYTQLGVCCLKGISDVIPQNTDMGYRLIRCGRDKGDTNAQKHLLQYKQPPYATVKCVKETVKSFSGGKEKPNYYVLNGNQADAQKWRDYLDIPRDEMFFVLAVNQVYSGQYAAICSSGIYFLTEKTLPRYCSWEMLKQKDLTRKESYGKIDLLSGEELLYSCDKNTVNWSVIPLLETILKRLG